MLPAVTAIAPTTPPPIVVATPVPGNYTLRVPPDNVPAPVSNVQIDNNARGGGGSVSGSAAQTLAGTPASSLSSFIPSFNGTPTTLSLSAETTFIAQLLSQDISTQAKSVLAEYEKLIAIAKVKYKPSNALQPQSEPAGVFGKLVQQQTNQARVIQQAASEPSAPASVAQALTAPAPKTAVGDTRTAKKPGSDNAPRRLADTPAVPTFTVNAYLATISRNESEKSPSVELA